MDGSLNWASWRTGRLGGFKEATASQKRCWNGPHSGIQIVCTHVPGSSRAKRRPNTPDATQQLRKKCPFCITRINVCCNGGAGAKTALGVRKLARKSTQDRGRRRRLVAPDNGHHHYAAQPGHCESEPWARRRRPPSAYCVRTNSLCLRPPIVRCLPVMPSLCGA